MIRHCFEFEILLFQETSFIFLEKLERALIILILKPCLCIKLFYPNCIHCLSSKIREQIFEAYLLIGSIFLWDTFSIIYFYFSCFVDNEIRYSFISIIRVRVENFIIHSYSAMLFIDQLGSADRTKNDRIRWEIQFIVITS